jgi:PLP dependent protein
MPMSDYGFVGERVQEVRLRVAQAAGRAGRAPESVSILAVTKFHPVEAVRAAYDAGMRLFGENRVQEAESKFPDFLASHPDASVHMIGHLQGNKAQKAVELFRCIESVDSRELLAEIAKRASASGRSVDILLELHTGEESKSGFSDRGALLDACSLIAGLPSVRLRGLMTMAPFTDDAASVRASFRMLRSLFEEISASRSFPGFDTLSMGMTNDFEMAVEEGSTLLRLGTILFGARV